MRTATFNIEIGSNEIILTHGSKQVAQAVFNPDWGKNDWKVFVYDDLKVSLETKRDVVNWLQDRFPGSEVIS